MTRTVVAQSSASPFPSRSAETILVVEDDASARAALVASLTSRGWAVCQAVGGRQALDLYWSIEPDVVILDLGLPDLDGIEVCRHARRFSSTIPIIVLTADGAEERMIAALEMGADDYMTKPYSMPQLLARVRVALRHRQLMSATIIADQRLAIGDIEVDLAAHAVALGGQLVELRPRQYRLLVALLRNPGRVLTFRALSKAVWGPDSDPKPDTLRNLVKITRDALGSGPRRPMIRNEHGVGYRLLVPETEDLATRV